MATFNWFNSTLKDAAEGKHDFSADTFTVALCAAANAPVATNRLLTDLTQIAYTNLSARALTLTASEINATNGWRVRFNDLVLTASGGAVATWRYVAVYNDTNADDLLVGWWDMGSDQTMADGDSRTLNFTDVNDVVISLSVA